MLVIVGVSRDRRLRKLKHWAAQDLSVDLDVDAIVSGLRKSSGLENPDVGPALEPDISNLPTGCLSVQFLIFGIGKSRCLSGILCLHPIRVIRDIRGSEWQRREADSPARCPYLFGTKAPLPSSR